MVLEKKVYFLSLDHMFVYLVDIVSGMVLSRFSVFILLFPF